MKDTQRFWLIVQIIVKRQHTNEIEVTYDPNLLDIKSNYEYTTEREFCLLKGTTGIDTYECLKVEEGTNGSTGKKKKKRDN